MDYTRITDTTSDGTASVPIIIGEAFSLYDRGLNVMPVQPGSKKPFGSHAFLDTTRLYRPWLPDLFQDSNLVSRMGRLSGNLFALDCDSILDFERIGKEIAKQELRPWIRNSTRGGQFWFRCSEGEVVNGKNGETQFLGHGVYSMAPPSIHPTGMVYEWLFREGSLPPLVSLDQLDFLPLQLRSQRRKKHNKRSKNTLPPVAYAVLEEKDTTGYVSNSEAEYAACLSLIAWSFTDGQIMSLFKTFTPPHYVKVGDKNFEQFILIKARLKSKDYQPKDKDADPARGLHSSIYITWAQNRAWPGRTGNSDKAVFLALCERLRMDQGPPFRASVRELAELSSMNKDTIPKVLKRLQASELVHLAGRDKVSGAGLYSLHLPDGLEDSKMNKKHTVGEAYAPVGVSVCFSYADHDAWFVRALGKSALNCYVKLMSEPSMTESELVTSTGRTRPTVRRALTKLGINGLAQFTGGGWRAVETSLKDLDQIAARFGTLGKSARKVTQHQTEREKRASLIFLEQKRVWQETQGQAPCVPE